MANTASLAFEIDCSQVHEATDALNDLTKAADRAAKAIKGLSFGGDEINVSFEVTSKRDEELIEEVIREIKQARADVKLNCSVK